MSPLRHSSVYWPPADIAFLEGLKEPCAQSMVKQIDRGCISGMTYRIEGERVYLNERPRLLYFIQIDGWEYTIKNDSSEFPILSFSYLDTALTHPLDKTVQNVMVNGRAMRRGYRIADKTLRVASYLMRQIAEGAVPDAQRVLNLYKLQPPHPLVPGFVQNSFSYAQSYFKKTD